MSLSVAHPKTSMTSPSSDSAASQDECQAWAVQTQAEVNTARALVCEASTQVSRNASITLDTKYEQSVHALLKGKLLDTSALTEMLKDQMLKVDCMLKQLKESHAELQSAHSAKWVPFCAVSRRLEMHERRPLEQCSNDKFQMDAEMERQVYSEARQQLLDVMQLTKEQMELLKGVKQEIHEDLNEKRRSYRLDHLSLLDGGHRTDLAVEEVACAPRLTEVLNIQPSSPQNAEPGTGNSNEEARRMRTKSLLEKADGIQESGQQRLNLNADMIVATDKTCKEASNRTLKGTHESVQTLTGLTQMLKDYTGAVDVMLKQLKESHGNLNSAYRAKWAPLCVVNRRLEIRERRPQEETSNDQFKMDAEMERDLHADARHQLSDAMALTKEQVELLEGIRQDMHKDIKEKRCSYRLDHLSRLDGGHRTDLAIEEVTRGPRLSEVLAVEPGSPQNAEGTEHSNEEVWKMRTNSLLEKADGILERGQQRLNLNADMMATTDRMCKGASNRTLKSMNESVQTLTGQKKALENEVAETEKMINSACMSLEKTTRRLKQHEGPLQTIRRQFLLRQQRTERENIRDPAHEVMEDHLSALKKTVQRLSSEAEETANVIDELKVTKQRLQEALQLKTMALRLDVSCTKVTQTNVSTLYMTAATRSPRQSSASPPDRGVKATASSRIHRQTGDSDAGFQSSNTSPYSSLRRLYSAPRSPRGRSAPRSPRGQSAPHSPRGHSAKPSSMS